MSDEKLRAQIVAISDMFRGGLTEFGLYEVWPRVKYGLKISDEREVKRITLEVVREMLKRGARAGQFEEPSSWMTYFEETAPDDVVARIDREWDALGGLPDIGDICSFEYPPREPVEP